MKTTLRLLWQKNGAASHRAFRLPGLAEIFAEYGGRIARYGKYEILGGAPDARSAVWVCDRGGKELSSEDLAKKLEDVKDSGKNLDILVGGPDGIPKNEIAQYNPALTWSFGPMTLPHELAAVVAAEQLYRAWTILKNEPYHFGH